MKKIIIWIVTLIFFVAFTFTAIKLNAAELNVKYTQSNEEGTFTLTLLEENKYELVAVPLGETDETIIRGTYKYYDEELNIITLYLSDIVFDTFQLNDETHTWDFYEIVDNTPTTDDNTQEEVDKVPTIVEQKTKEITDYVIALVVAFLGSSTFYAIVKALTKKGINALTNKVTALEDQNKISANAKIEYENKIAELEKQLNQATDKMDVVLGQIANYLEVDANKQKQMAELLEKLLPPLTIEDSDIKEGE